MVYDGLCNKIQSLKLTKQLLHRHRPMDARKPLPLWLTGFPKTVQNTPTFIKEKKLVLGKLNVNKKKIDYVGRAYRSVGRVLVYYI